MRPKKYLIAFHYYNTNRLLRAIPGNTNPDVAWHGMACTTLPDPMVPMSLGLSLLTEGLVFSGIARASWLVLCLLTDQGNTETNFSSELTSVYYVTSVLTF